MEFHFIANFDALLSFLDEGRNLAQAGYCMLARLEGKI